MGLHDCVAVCLCVSVLLFDARPAQHIETKLGVMIPSDTRVNTGKY